MSTDREAQFRKLVEQFPTSPLGYLSLGKLLLEERRYAEAATTLKSATQLAPAYVAALVALGEALAKNGQHTEARAVWEEARTRALEQNHPSLAAEVDELLREL